MDLTVSILIPVIQVLLGLLGIIMVTHDDWVQRHRKLVIGCFVGLSLFGLIIAIYQSWQSTKAQSDLAHALTNINVNTDETKRLQGQNNDLQKQLVHSNDEIRALAVSTLKDTKEAAKQLTGDGGYVTVFPVFSHIDPQIDVAIPDEIDAFFGVQNYSKYPTFDIKVSILHRVERGEGRSFLNPEFRLRDGTVFPAMPSDTTIVFDGEAGDSMPGSPMTYLPRATAKLRKSRDNIFDIAIWTRAGFYREHFVVSWDGKEWQSDYSLERERGGNKNEIIHRISKTFPYIKKP